MVRTFLVFSIFFVCITNGVSSQTKTIETLKGQIKLYKDNRQKLPALFLLCEQRQSLSTDTLHKYALLAKNLSTAENNITKALADYYLANYYVKAGFLDSALITCNVYIEKFQNDKAAAQLLLKYLALKGQVLVKSNNYKEGLAEYYQLLKNAEQCKDTLMQMVAKNGIGWVYMEMDQNKEALKWFFRALETSNNEFYHQKNSNIYSNIAAVYIATHKYDSSKYFVNKAINFSRKDENFFFLCNSLNILADNYIAQQKPAFAEAPLKEAINIREQIGDPYYIVSDLSQLAIFYAGQNQPQKGIESSLRGIAIAKKYNLISKLPYLELALAQNYKSAGKYLQYGETLEEVLALKDSVYQKNTEKALVEIRTKYNDEKKENLIIQQKFALHQKNYILLAVSISILFITIISFILFSQYRRKQKMIIENIKEEERRKAQESIRTAEENERKRISADLHDNLGAYASAISANVEDLFNSNSTTGDTLINNIKNNADDIMNSLRETIWVLNKTEIHITSISDRFKIYVSRIRDSYPRFTININEDIIKDTILSPESALHMLRIMQEAFHNAVKHSNGHCITIDIRSDARIEIIITDNGEGFFKNESNGNGIANMRKRASANGWSLRVINLKPAGTAVELCS